MINSYCQSAFKHLGRLGGALLLVLLVSCGTPAKNATTARTTSTQGNSAAASEVVLYALGLLNTGYRFGGSNPESGLDCSGMTAYIFREALGMNLPHNAAQQARLGKEVSIRELQPGDLVFYNTNGKGISHVGLYIGENRFVHAPATNGRIRIALLNNPWFSQRYETARRLLN